MEICTAVGRYKKRNNQVVILRKKEAFTVSPYEYLLWKTLLWQVLRKEQVQTKYEAVLQEADITPKFGFHYYFARLINMGLIATGYGDDMDEAMLDLTKDLYPMEIEISKISKIKVAATAMTKYKVPPATIKDSLKGPELNENEQEVLSVIQKFPFDTKTMLTVFEHRSILSNSELMRILVLKSLVRLYMIHRVIVFE